MVFLDVFIHTHKLLVTKLYDLCSSRTPAWQRMYLDTVVCMPRYTDIGIDIDTLKCRDYNLEFVPNLSSIQILYLSYTTE